MTNQPANLSAPYESEDLTPPLSAHKQSANPLANAECRGNHATGISLASSTPIRDFHKHRILKLRLAAFERQNGHCYYCDWPMWLSNSAGFATSHSLTDRQTSWLQATAEHLQPHSEGGCTTSVNIVAACLHCNTRRHGRRKPLSPDTYKALVARRLERGRWHSFKISLPRIPVRSSPQE